MDEFITKQNNIGVLVGKKRVFSGCTIKPNEKKFLMIYFMLLTWIFLSQAMAIESLK